MRNKDDRRRVWNFIRYVIRRHCGRCRDIGEKWSLSPRTSSSFHDQESSDRWPGFKQRERYIYVFPNGKEYPRV